MLMGVTDTQTTHSLTCGVMLRHSSKTGDAHPQLKYKARPTGPSPVRLIAHEDNEVLNLVPENLGEVEGERGWERN